MAIEKDGEEEVKIFSMDVESLYPKLDKEDMVETIQELVITSDVKVENVDDKELAKFVAVMVEKEEIKKKRLENIVQTAQWNLKETTHRK